MRNDDFVCDRIIMVKELRTLAIDAKLHRSPKVVGDAWGLANVQPFLPCLEQLFKTEHIASVADYGLKFPEEVDSVIDETHIKTTLGRTLPVHRKTTMILSPFKTMKGDYAAPGLPKPAEVARDIADRLQSPHTAAYVGALTSSLLSLSGCQHFPTVYGVYASIAHAYLLDISDDYEDIADRPWFMNNVGKTFQLKLRPLPGADTFTHTRSQRHGIALGDDLELDVEDIDVAHVEDVAPAECTPEYSAPEHDESNCTESSEEDVFEIDSCKCEDDEDESECDEEPESFAWVTFPDVPVVTTVMDVCEGTFYDLLERDPVHLHAFVCQLVMALAYAQRAFGFVHNDLHGNNVMYTKTDQEYLYYKHSGVCYRVPTYGILIKVIDFDRAALSVRLTGMKDPRFFMSSQFQVDEEAAGQYNMEPFYTSTHARIPLNPSFDLVRFATSLFWDLFPLGPDHAYDHPLFEMFKHWMTLPDGSSVLYRASHDNHDRYHDFDLYKQIARACANAVPRKELARFKTFIIPKLPADAPFFCVDV